MNLILFSLPWILVALYLVLFFRNPRDIPASEGDRAIDLPFVSIIVPARNEEVNIEGCVSSLTALDYPDFEILVVDDESLDRTAEIVEGLPPGNASRLELVRGARPPEGWIGKPWACWQGARQAEGKILLFTDADTVHAPGLLRQVVVGLERDDADVYTLVGRQVMGSFWERVVQPQFFMLLAARYPRAGNPKAPHQWKNAIANGQYLLFTRDAYESSGGHETVAREVVEDLRYAQVLVRGGWRLVMRATEGLQTRMYRSLPDLVAGWSKNVTTGALQTTTDWLLPIILPFSFLTGVTLWLLPPAVFGWALLTGTGGIVLSWGALTTGLSVVLWCSASVLMKSNPFYGFLYPLGALIGLYIFIISWRKGTRIQWKQRDYEVTQQTRVRPPDHPAAEDAEGRPSGT
ncbi:MAG: glycosyltransferase [Gemmatimonadetes bacterium]|nr:glycosyltransferase [Gemmatimonadota bacterium]NNM04013.1 glycosyltransferase [Gemmatimonadota bacterium]